MMKNGEEVLKSIQMYYDKVNYSATSKVSFAVNAHFPFYVDFFLRNILVSFEIVIPDPLMHD